MSPTGSPSYPTPLQVRGRATNRAPEINLSGRALYVPGDARSDGAVRPVREVLRLHLREPRRLRGGRPVPRSDLPPIPPADATKDLGPRIRDGKPRPPARPTRLRRYGPRPLSRAAHRRAEEGEGGGPPDPFRARGHASVRPRNLVRRRDLHVRGIRLPAEEHGHRALPPVRTPPPGSQRNLRFRVLAALRREALSVPVLVPQGRTRVRARPLVGRPPRRENKGPRGRVPILRLPSAARPRSVRRDPQGSNVHHRGNAGSPSSGRVRARPRVRGRERHEEGVRSGPPRYVPRLRGVPSDPWVIRRTFGTGGGPRCRPSPSASRWRTP